MDCSGFQTRLTGVDGIETNATIISLDVLERICRALKCEPGDILVREGK